MIPSFFLKRDMKHYKKKGEDTTTTEGYGKHIPKTNTKLQKHL